MIDSKFVSMMARYNHWQNTSLYTAADGIGEAARKADAGAFFGSIHETLSHLLWGDQIWMSRFADMPIPEAGSISASSSMITEWDELSRERRAMDEKIIGWADSVTDDFLSGNLTWHSGAANRDVTKPVWELVTHFFNHQTHHRGQVHAMLTREGARPEDTDLFLMTG